MLRKLLKYDFKLFMRSLLPVYGAMLALSLILGIMMRLSNASSVVGATRDGFGGSETIFVITIMLFIFSFMACGIMTLIILIQSYHKNLLGSQGYLMFSLPVKTSTLVGSKILSAGLLTFLSGVVGFIACCIIIFTQAGTEGFHWLSSSDWSQIIDAIMQHHAELGEIILSMILLLVSSIVSCFSIVAHIYAAISIGHLWNNHRVAGSILAYIGISIIESTVASILGNLSFMGLVIFNTFDQLQFSTNGTLGVQILIYTVLTIVLWFVSWFILDRKLNLE